jgi:hypothetical protein
VDIIYKWINGKWLATFLEIMQWSINLPWAKIKNAHVGCAFQ